MSLREDYAYCERIIKNNSASFYRAFSDLPLEKRNAVYAVYAFCRVVDDAIDVHQDAVQLAQLKQSLLHFQLGDTPDTPIFRALRDVFNRYEMNIEPFFDMIKGQEKDQHFHQPHNEEELNAYCYEVAGTVGLMLLPIVAQANHHQLVAPAIRLGTAMQYTNLLRDVGEDYALGRIYLPKSWMDAYGVTEEMLAKHQLTDQFKTLWRYAANQAEAWYKEHLKLIKVYDQDAQRAMKLAIFFYREILREVKRNGYDCLTKRNRISKLRKIVLAVLIHFY